MAADRAIGQLDECGRWAPKKRRRERDGAPDTAGLRARASGFGAKVAVFRLVGRWFRFWSCQAREIDLRWEED